MIFIVPRNVLGDLIYFTQDQLNIAAIGSGGKELVI